MQYVQTLPVVTAPTAEDTVHATEAVAMLHPVNPEMASSATVMMLDPRLPALEQMWVPRPEELEKERRRLCRRLAPRLPPPDGGRRVADPHGGLVKQVLLQGGEAVVADVPAPVM